MLEVFVIVNFGYVWVLRYYGKNDVIHFMLIVNLVKFSYKEVFWLHMLVNRLSSSHFNFNVLVNSSRERDVIFHVFQLSSITVKTQDPYGNLQLNTFFVLPLAFMG